MTRNQKKDKIQSEAVTRSVASQFLCLEWATGCGKTLGTAKIVENFLRVKNNAVGYLVCKESTHRKNWKDDLIKHGKDSILDNTKTILYASLHKQVEVADFIVLDECHALTPKRIQSLVGICKPNTRIIFLSATIPKDKKALMDGLGITIDYYKITLNKAFSMGLLPEPSLIVHEVELNPEEKAKYKEFNDRIESYLKKSEDLKQHYLVRNRAHDMYLNTASFRKRFIAEVKTKYLTSLIAQFRKDNSRFICFTGSVDQANEIGQTSAVHSKNLRGVNQDLIDCFNRGECDELFAVKMLREGVNLFNIERGVITQLDSGITSFFQMLGRCLRHQFPEMHLFVLKDTQDVVYFKKSMRSFNKKYIKYRDYGIIL